MLPASYSLRWKRLHAPSDTANMINGQKVPCPRSGHSIVWDESKKSPMLFLYGGHDPAASEHNAYLSDVWSYDINAGKWMQRKVKGEYVPGRYHHSCTVVGGKAYIFGGFTGRHYLSELVTFTLPSDKKGQVSFDKPQTHSTSEMVPPRRDHSAVLAGSRLVVLGGFDASVGCYNDIIVIYRKTLQFSKPPVAGAHLSSRRGHASALAGNSVVIFGGVSAYENYKNDVYLLNTMAMTLTLAECSGDIPQPRAWHTVSFLNNYLILFGGVAANGDVLGDVHILDLESMEWERVIMDGDTPPPRYAHTATVVGSNIYIFGGKTVGGVVMNDLWIIETNIRNSLEPV